MPQYCGVALSGQLNQGGATMRRLPRTLAIRCARNPIDDLSGGTRIRPGRPGDADVIDVQSAPGRRDHACSAANIDLNWEMLSEDSPALSNTAQVKLTGAVPGAVMMRSAITAIKLLR
jgi:hypothetical protein